MESFARKGAAAAAGRSISRVGADALNGGPLLESVNNGDRLALNAARRFGSLDIVRTEALGGYGPFAGMGPEPLGPDFGGAYLARALAGRAAPIKALLLHQGIVAGVGNIYADEALWDARIHPLRPGGSLTAAQVRRLHAAVVGALERGIDSRGASIRDYRDVDGERGEMQERFAVYARTGEPCPRCGTPIEKIRVAQRGTHLCPRCTRPPSG